MSPPQFTKASLPTLFNVFGSLREVSLLQTANASAPILSIPRGTTTFSTLFLPTVVPVTVLPSIFKKEIFTPIALNCANLMPKALLRTENTEVLV